jgi:protein-disulfide isomerase
MNHNKDIFDMVMVAAVGALTAAGTSYLVQYFFRGLATGPARVEWIARDYLAKNPEILIEMATELDKRKAAEQQDQAATRQQKVIAENADAIFRSSLSHAAGNPHGDVSLVEFFDYNCGYCRLALPTVIKLVKDDGKIRLVLKELPIFGSDSVAAAKLALASNKQGKYFEMHQRLFSEPGRANKEKGLLIAKELGLDVDQLQKDAEDPDIERTLEEAKQLAHKLQGSRLATPYYLIGDRVLDGVSENFFEQLKADVAHVRRDGCAGTC